MTRAANFPGCALVFCHFWSSQDLWVNGFSETSVLVVEGIRAEEEKSQRTELLRMFRRSIKW